jgi:hypothetical protein
MERPANLTGKLFSRPNNTFMLFNILLFGIFLFLNFSVPYNDIQWRGFPDCYDYLNQSRLSFFNSDFFFTTSGQVVYPRTFAIPLIYKLVGSDPESIVAWQKIIYSVSVSFFSYCGTVLFTKYFLKYIWVICSFLVLGSWANLGWTQVLLSESLGLSFFLIWLGSFILLKKTWSTPILVLHILFLILTAFSRDNLPYFLLVFYASDIAVRFLLKEGIKFPVTAFLITASIFFIQNRLSQIGGRHRLPLTNTIITRIVPHKNYLNWFKEKGLPMTDSLQKNFSNINPEDESRVKVYGLYSDTAYKPFFNWILTEGKSTYIKFILTHPRYFFMLDEDMSAMNRKLFADNTFYYNTTPGYSLILSRAFPLFTPLLLLILLVLLVPVLIKSKTKLIRFMQLIICFLLMILLNYNADTFEVGRHMYLNHFIAEMLGVCIILLIIDNYKNYKFSLKQKTTS